MANLISAHIINHSPLYTIYVPNLGHSRRIGLHLEWHDFAHDLEEMVKFGKLWFCLLFAVKSSSCHTHCQTSQCTLAGQCLEGKCDGYISGTPGTAGFGFKSSDSTCAGI